MPSLDARALLRLLLVLAACAAAACSDGVIGSRSDATVSPPGDADLLDAPTRDGSPIDAESPRDVGPSGDGGVDPTLSCAHPDWSDPTWLARSGCLYVFDLHTAYFNNWCYKTGACTDGEPPSGQTRAQLVERHDLIAAVVSLEGLVNRDAPTLYVIGSERPDVDWLDELPARGVWLAGARREPVETLDDLLALFADHPNVRGSVSWSEREPYTMNVAYSIGAADDLVVVREGSAISARVAATFPTTRALRGAFSSKEAAYDYLISAYLRTGRLAPSLALVSDGWVVQRYLTPGAPFPSNGHGLLQRDVLVSQRVMMIGYHPHPDAVDPTQGGGHRGEGARVLGRAVQAIRDVLDAGGGPARLFEASGWPPSEYNVPNQCAANNDVNCAEQPWIELLSRGGGVLAGGPGGYYSLESANKSFFLHGPGIDVLAQPPPMTVRQLLRAGYASGPPRNFSFEAGDAGWTLTSSNRAVYDMPPLARSGSRFLQINVTAADRGEGFEQSVTQPLVQGDFYRFEVSARLASAGTEATIELVLRSGATEVCRSRHVLRSTEWASFSCEGAMRAATAGTTSMRVELQTPGVNVAFDDVFLDGLTRVDVDPARRFMSFFLGDYDFPMAMQLVPLGVHPYVWRDAQRASSVPSAMGFTALTLEDAPPLFAYFAATREPNQWFVMPNSGAGYVNPAYLPSRFHDAWIARTSALQRRVGYRAGWVHDGSAGAAIDDATAAGTAERRTYRVIAPDGVYFTAAIDRPVDGSVIDGLPILPMYGGVFSAGTSTSAAATTITTHLRSHATRFLMMRTVFVSPHAVGEVADAVRAQIPAATTVDPITLLYLFRQGSSSPSVRSRVSVLAHTLPRRVARGAAIDATILVRNDGWDAWAPASAVGGGACDASAVAGRSCERLAFGVTPGSVQPTGLGTPPTFSYSERVAFEGVVYGGEQVTLPLSFTAPSAPGTYTLQLDVVSEGLRFFEVSGNVPWQFVMEVE